MTVDLARPGVDLGIAELLVEWFQEHPKEVDADPGTLANLHASDARWLGKVLATPEDAVLRRWECSAAGRFVELPQVPVFRGTKGGQSK